jgi:hypothetical protein
MLDKRDETDNKMIRGTWRNSIRTLLGVAIVAFCCRVVIPTGFMPAALGDGGPFVLCPTGLPSGLLNDGGHHGGDQHGSDGSHEMVAWEFCPLGLLFDDAPLSYQAAVQDQHIRTAAPATELASLVFARVPAVFRSRSPPSSKSSI